MSVAADCCDPAPPVPVALPDRPQIALAGNPNVGKTTLFNALTSSLAKVSNYPGITVERRRAPFSLPAGGADLHDLPGTYSLNARSGEEQIALDALVGLGGERAPDVVVVCLDATQLARSAYLLLQCQELGARVVGALTMVDEAGAAAPDARQLGALFDCEIVAVTARTKRGLPELVTAIDRALRAERTARWRWQPSATLRAALESVLPALPASWRTPARYRASLPTADDAVALWALTCIDSGEDGDELVGVPPELRAAVGTVAHPRALDDEAVLARWTWLDREIPKLGHAKTDRSTTERIDRVLLHRGIGFVVFAAVMAGLFMALFAGAAPLIDGIDHALKALAADVHRVLGDGIFTDFLADGVIAGVGTVLEFLPQILMLFLFLGFLEDCGYLARVAYLMDRVMRSMNLHGKAFVPMLFGFACAVPAITATRTMERKRDRILTMMVVPLMTCSARLPVYTLIIGALIPGRRLTQAMLMVGMYAFSVTTSLVAAWVMSKTIKPLKAKRLPFIIELPPYRWPRLRDVVRAMWLKSSMFLREAGTVILACSIALWALLYFPRHLPAGSPDYTAEIAKAPTDDARVQLEARAQAAHLEASYAGRIGHAMEPAIAPLGFDWKIGVGLVGAFAAREVFISTLGIVYAVGNDADAGSEPLRQALHDAKHGGRQAYPPLVGLSLMVFFALAMQCMSTLAVVRRESGGLAWPTFLFAYMTVLAYVASLVVYQGGKLLGFA
ncbi:MAG TPA: ferrous iron transport protein B [Kofleriaceae bacterium]|jgi:ferrous iron transport protein B